PCNRCRTNRSRFDRARAAGRLDLGGCARQLAATGDRRDGQGSCCCAQRCWPYCVNEGPRYAIYFVPDAGTDLYCFGAAILGYDCYTGSEVAHPAGGLGTAAGAEVTREAGSYGFHATLKAPFRLRSEFQESDLVQALRRFAGLGLASAPILVPAIDTIAGFIAIVPHSQSPAIDGLAADCVT